MKYLVNTFMLAYLISSITAFAESVREDQFENRRAQEYTYQLEELAEDTVYTAHNYDSRNKNQA